MATRIKKEKKFFKECLKCGKQQGYVSKYTLARAIKLGAKCKTCAYTDEGIGNHRTKYLKKLRDTYVKVYCEKLTLNAKELRDWSLKVKKRDNYTCLRCNKVAKAHYMNAHHVVPYQYFYNEFDVENVSNGVTLCRSCHVTLHKDIDRITISGIKLMPSQFQAHAKHFIDACNASSQSDQTPPGYTSVFQPSVTIVKE